MLYTFKDTEFEIKNTDIINTWVEKSYLPFIYNGRTMDMVRGREISRYYEQSDFACSRILSAMLILTEFFFIFQSYFKIIVKHNSLTVKEKAFE